MKRFAGAVTVPIMQPVARGILPIGTGTFLRSQERLFIVTAAHLFEDQPLDGFFVPSSPIEGDAVRLVGSIVRAKDREQVDVAVIEISDSATKTKLSENWGAITLDNVSSASPDGIFVLVGYPTAYQTLHDGTVEYGVATTFTTRIAAPLNARDIDESIDLFFKYSKVAISEDGVPMAIPHLRGASGASIWEFREPYGDSIWTAEQSVRVVGVQASTMDGEWFRATSWEVVKNALRYKNVPGD